MWKQRSIHHVETAASHDNATVEYYDLGERNTLLTVRVEDIP